MGGNNGNNNSGGGGVWHPKAVLFLLLWYFWSGCTLFLNKYVVFYMKGDSIFLGKTTISHSVVIILAVLI